MLSLCYLDCELLKERKQIRLAMEALTYFAKSACKFPYLNCFNTAIPNENSTN